jgi:hypothetical protein
MSASDDIFNNLISSGGLKSIGKDPETGEEMYVKTDILKHINPELDRGLSLYFSETAMKLWANGFIDMDVTVKDPVVTLTEKAFDLQQRKAMDKDERLVLQEIIRIILEKK